LILAPRKTVVASAFARPTFIKSNNNVKFKDLMNINMDPPKLIDTNTDNLKGRKTNPGIRKF